MGELQEYFFPNLALCSGRHARVNSVEMCHVCDIHFQSIIENILDFFAP